MWQALAVIAVAVIAAVLWFFRQRAPALARVRETSRFTLIDDGKDGGKLAEADPEPLISKKGREVTWVIANDTDKDIRVTMTGFRLEDPSSPPRSPFANDPGKTIQPGKDRKIKGRIQADAARGRYWYTIDLDPGTPHNTPEIKIMD
jgi:hypothetical protein